MSLRHIARVVAIQTLYELDINESLSISNDLLKDTLKRNVLEFTPDLKDISFALGLAEEVVSRQITLDEIIQKAAPEWPIEKISIVDRNVLRVGLCELLFGDKENVPPKVAIDEAIEIAKEFGGESSGKFVNGVLGAVYKEMGEPGKMDKSSKAVHIEELVGVLLTTEKDGVRYIGMVHDIFNHWTLCKSHRSEGESNEDAVKRVVLKEFGLPDAKIIEQIGQNAYIAHHPEKGKVKKQVEYYLAELDYAEPKVEKDKGLDDAKWWNVSEVSQLPTYEDMRPIILKAIEKFKHE